MSQYFINPYNFVSFPENIQPERKKVEKGYKGLTGYLSCSLTTKTLLSIPGQKYVTEDLNKKGHIPETNEDIKKKFQLFDFINVNGTPFIPGSELRGCIRNIYETITNSCFSVINDDVLSMRANFKTFGQPGVLVKQNNGKWVIYKAKSSKAKDIPASYNNVVKRTWRNLKNKKDETIEYRYNKNEIGYCSETDYCLTRLQKTCDIFRNNNKDDKRYQDNLTAFEEKLKNGGPVVVFYLYVNGKFEYLSPAQVSRTLMDNTISSLLGSHKACSEDTLCPACRLFGRIANNDSIAGKVRFSDAFSNEIVKVSSEYVLLPELASPHTSSLEFYTFGNNDRVRTYDQKGTKLRGRKYYYHGSPKYKIISNTSSETNYRRQSVKYVPEKSTFDFKVYFENITEEELNMLYWSLTLGENRRDGNLMQKIGHGRPVGFGSVKIIVNEIVTRNANDAYKLEPVEIDVKKATEKINSTTLNELRNITNFYFISDEDKKLIKYPHAVGFADQENFKWFQNNRQIINGVAEYKQKLPKLSDNNQKLEANIKYEAKKR